MKTTKTLNICGTCRTLHSSFTTFARTSGKNKQLWTSLSNDISPFVSHCNLTCEVLFARNTSTMKSILQDMASHWLNRQQYGHSIVNTNTCTISMSLIKIYLKFLKNTPTCFGHLTIIREFFSSSLKSPFSTFFNNTLDIPMSNSVHGLGSGTHVQTAIWLNCSYLRIYLSSHILTKQAMNM